MEIEVVWGTGEGQTQLSAFDTALAAGGIHNYNLVTLSSVVPADATVAVRGTHEKHWPVGEIIGAVLAETESTVAGETIAAGLGWASADEGGIFMEATAGSKATVEELLDRGLATAKDQRGWDWDPGFNSKIVEHTVTETGAAVVAAVYGPLAGERLPAGEC